MGCQEETDQSTERQLQCDCIEHVYWLSRRQEVTPKETKLNKVELAKILNQIFE